MPRISGKNIERIRNTCEGSPHEIDLRRNLRVRNATKTCIACSQTEVENDTVCNSTCTAIETRRLQQIYKLRLCWKEWRMKRLLIISFLTMNQPLI
ncbi:hypothetical protein TNIN_418121 [Trichonephila inaurata madagascariensis]|uniref:Uncharacterized protein n=1 Tax=Trichonephila inaurata madagascariensis TaxID=2747483 RepID=A0A8X6XBZ2_9ARAC|nr:hypothetical protein TNIN_418121 [Trichonephila inaurata madagascariensis]